MIKNISLKDKFIEIKNLIEEDIGRNYFILLGLNSNKIIFDKVFGEYHNGKLKTILFKRKSGVLQFYSKPEYEFDIIGFTDIIKRLDYTALIGPKSYCQKLMDKKLFRYIKKGAFISKLDINHKTTEVEEYKKHIRAIGIEDLDEIVSLYEKIFESFAPKNVMEYKINTNRGRGICIDLNGEIISVAQTDFESKDSAIIVGVGTKIGYRNKGYATVLVEELSKILLKEKTNIYLQYDNLEAGNIYERIGFKTIDQVIHYIK